MDDSIGGEEEAFDFDAATGSEPEREPMMDDDEIRQEDFDFPAVSEDDERHAGSMPAYLRRWRQRTSRTR
jgi:hypothetical protein